MDKIHYGIIYKATAPNGKAYIGQTTQTLTSRISQHKCNAKRDGRCYAINRAIRTYGDQITWRIIGWATTKEALDELEVYAIANHRTLAPNGYNLKTGGDSAGSPCAETRAKLSAVNKGQVPWNKGKKHTAEARAKMSAVHKGKTISPEHRAKLSIAHTGRKMSPEAVAKAAASHIGKKRSAEARANMSAAQKGKKRPPRTAAHRANLSAACRGIPKTAEARTNISIAQKRYQARQRNRKLFGSLPLFC